MTNEPTRREAEQDRQLDREDRIRKGLPQEPDPTGQSGEDPWVTKR